MKLSSLVNWISLLLLLGDCFACENKENRLKSVGKYERFNGRKPIQTRYWQYLSATDTFSLFLKNISIIQPKQIFSTYETNKKNQGIKHRIQSSEDMILSLRLQSVISPFALTSNKTKNLKCREDSIKFIKYLNSMDLWALKMYDSSGKFPSGLLNGNINQFGDFDECLSVNEPDLNIKGRYCLAYLQIHLTKGDNESHLKLQKAFKLLHSHFLFRSKLTDPGHRVPRFSTLNWGLCIPHSCSFEDVEFHLKSVVEAFVNGTGFTVEVRVEPQMCQERKPFVVSWSFFIVSCMFLFIMILVSLATLKDFYFSKTSSEFSNATTISNIFLGSLLHCFSLRRNINVLLNTSRKSDDIKSAHGIRMTNALMLLLCHKSMALFFVPYSNRTTMVEKLSQPWSIIARIASLYTDSFIMLSGLLISYSFIKTLDEKGKLNLKMEYVNRLIRVIPPLIAVILMSTFIIPELGSGPQWNLIVSHHSDKCRKHWWKNLFFIHNYFGFENMCLTHTHHMGIDTQLFLISPLLVYILFKWPGYGSGGLVVLAALSTLARYEATLKKNLSFFIYPGITISRMFDTANYSYIIPFHRLTSYVVGIFFGFILRRYAEVPRIKSSHLKVGWAVIFSFLSFVLSKAYEMNRPGHVYDNREAALYAALAPIAWCIFVGWIIFVCQMGFGGILGKVISSKYFLIWTRLSYSVYLTQFPIFFFNVGLQRYPQHYSIFTLVNIIEYLSILGISTMWTLLFDMPFVNMKNLFVQR